MLSDGAERWVCALRVDLRALTLVKWLWGLGMGEVCAGMRLVCAHLYSLMWEKCQSVAGRNRLGVRSLLARDWLSASERVAPRPERSVPLVGDSPSEIVGELGKRILAVVRLRFEIGADSRLDLGEVGQA